ncbi:hypothetical protein ABZZ20_25880 [Streptomyces sp. NPDC006430]|uniref:hypothetical protein n=1 Tax=Streptomyces sp. NPDC006430 TaxID=3154299 RepID=UPI0033ACD5C5
MLMALATTGCRNDAAPAWGYPDLRTTLGTLSRALEAGCDGTAPEHCADDLDRLDALAERAFAAVLDHHLLDDAYVEARNEVDRARELRRTIAAQVRSRRDPHHLLLIQAVAAERLAYRHLLAALERVRTAPPPGDRTEPV